MRAISAHLREKREYIIIIFCLEAKSDGIDGCIYIYIPIYLARVVQRDKWSHVQERSLLRCEHACPRYFTFCRARQTTLRNIPREILTIGGRILCTSGNALRGTVESITFMYKVSRTHAICTSKHSAPSFLICPL